MIKVRDIEALSLEEIKANFREIAHTGAFSAAATCGFNTLSADRKYALIEDFKKAGLELAPNEVDYAVRIIADRMINRV